MGKKLTLEQVEEEFVKRGYEPLFDEYNNNQEKLLAKTQEGYLILINLNHLKDGREPMKFSDKNSNTIYNIKLWLKLNNSKYELLSTEYISAGKNKLLWRCPIHGEFEMSWNNLMSGQGCHECFKIDKPTIEEVKSEFIKRGYIPLFNKYKNNKENLLAKTEDGYKFIITLYSLKNTENRCIFHKSNPYTIENIKIWLETNKSPYKLISTEYKNNCTNLIWNCPMHGNFKMTWAGIRSGCSCQKCICELRSGENNHKWKGGITPLHNYLRTHMSKWKTETLKKYNSKCDITGNDENIIIHHLYGFDQLLQKTMEELNLPIHDEINKYTDIELKSIEDKCLEMHWKYGLGVCLSIDEHKKFHSMFGYGNNTPEQFEEYKEIRVKELNINTDLKVAN